MEKRRKIEEDLVALGFNRDTARLYASSLRRFAPGMTELPEVAGDLTSILDLLTIVMEGVRTARERTGRAESSARNNWGRPFHAPHWACTELGVAQGSSREQIKAAYHAKMRTAHPDLNPEDPTAHERAQRIIKAYEELSR